MELVIAGVAAATAGTLYIIIAHYTDVSVRVISFKYLGAICNPLEVVKIRMQLQGELKARGQYAIHYRFITLFLIFMLLQYIIS